MSSPISVSARPLLGVHHISKQYGAQPVLQDISLTVNEGDRIGLIGRNGSGKTTLLKIMAGLMPPDLGEVTRRQGLRVSVLEQRAELNPEWTVGRLLEQAQSDVRQMLSRHHEAIERLATLPDGAPGRARLAAETSQLEHALDLAGAWDLEQDIKRVTVALALPDRDRLIGTLSGGEHRRVCLASAILQRPDLLLLDEPTNHIDLPSIEWIEQFLASYAGSCVLVTHDRYFLDRVVNRIVEMSFASLLVFPGSYARFLEYRADRNAQEAKSEANRTAMIRRELEWIKRGPKARGTKQKARIKRFESLEASGPPPADRPLQFAIPAPNRLGKLVLEAEGLARAREGRTLFQDVSIIMQEGMRVGIVGPNGCGKTTLLRVLMALEPPDAGTVRRGEATGFLYVDQTHEEINPEHTIIRHVSDGAMEIVVNGRTVFVPAYLENFLFDRAAVTMPMRNLSGGERNRIDLAKKLLRGGNFLVLDEPTNDLDLATLRVLEEAVLAFQGCALLVSHDRFFLNRVCTHVLGFEPGGRLTFVAGNYDDYSVFLAERKAQEEAEKPASPVAAAASSPKKTEGRRRLTWQEKREFEGMEDEILAAETEVDRLENLIHAPGFYEQDHTAVRDTLAALESAKTRVEGLYTRWAELSAFVDGSA